MATEKCAYSGSHWTKRGLTPEQVISEFVASGQRAFRRNLESGISLQADIAYGEGSKHKYDLWAGEQLFLSSSAEPPCRLFIVIHGGYWAAGDRKCCTWMVRPLVSDGRTAVASLGYDLATDLTDGGAEKIEQIVAQVACGVKAIVERVPAACRVYIMGHSAGAHLAYMALLQPHIRSVAGRIAALLLISAVYDLRPLHRDDLGDTRPLNLSAASAAAWSPALHTADFADATGSHRMKVLAAAGGDESPHFLAAAEDMAQRLRSAGGELDVRLAIVDDEDHFTIMENLEEPRGELIQVIQNFCT